MTPVVDMSAFFAEIDQLSQYGAAQPFLQEPIDDCLSLVREQRENHLLNTQALIEHGLLKARLFSSVIETNKFLELDDQIIVQEYKFCASLSHRKRVFVMEFRQITSELNDCNHALELIFRASPDEIHNSGHSTLILTRENRQFIWRQLQSVAGGPTGTGRILAGLIMRWLQNDGNFFLRTASVLNLS